MAEAETAKSKAGSESSGEEVSDSSEPERVKEPGTWGPKALLFPQALREYLEDFLHGRYVYFNDRPVLRMITDDTGVSTVGDVDGIIAKLEALAVKKGMPTDFCWSLDWTSAFWCTVAYEGFLSISSEIGECFTDQMKQDINRAMGGASMNIYIIQPKLHTERCTIDLTLANAPKGSVPNSDQLAALDKAKKQRKKRRKKLSRKLTEKKEALLESEGGSFGFLLSRRKSRSETAETRKLKEEISELQAKIESLKSESETELEVKKMFDQMSGAIYISRNVKKRSKNYTLSVNIDQESFERVCRGCLIQHGDNWLYPPMQYILKQVFDLNYQMYSRLYEFCSDESKKSETDADADSGGGGSDVIEEKTDESPEEKQAKLDKLLKWMEMMKKSRLSGGVSVMAVELRDAHTDELIAGELGSMVGAVYTSLTGFCSARDGRKSHSGAGTVQMIALGKHLQKCGVQIWDLGMFMSYKASIGGIKTPRKKFVNLFRKFRTGKISTSLSSSSSSPSPEEKKEDTVEVVSGGDVSDQPSELSSKIGVNNERFLRVCTFGEKLDAKEIITGFSFSS